MPTQAEGIPTPSQKTLHDVSQFIPQQAEVDDTWGHTPSCFSLPAACSPFVTTQELPAHNVLFLLHVPNDIATSPIPLTSAFLEGRQQTHYYSQMKPNQWQNVV